MGIVQDKKHVTTSAFQQAGDKIYLLGPQPNDINCSEYLYSWHKVKLSPTPAFDLDTEFNVQGLLKTLTHDNLVQSAHDCADGGLYITLLESGMTNGFGFNIEAQPAIRKDAFLFGEAQSRIVVSVAPGQEAAFEQAVANSGVASQHIGTVTSGNITLWNQDWNTVSAAKHTFDTAFETYLA